MSERPITKESLLELADMLADAATQIAGTNTKTAAALVSLFSALVANKILSDQQFEDSKAAILRTLESADEIHNLVQRVSTWIEKNAGDE